MGLQWTAAGLAEAQKGFRRVKGHRYLPEHIAAIRRELNPTPTEEAAAARAALSHSPARTPPKIWSGRRRTSRFIRRHYKIRHSKGDRAPRGRHRRLSWEHPRPLSRPVEK
jgi:hypothetical protein